jgi:hypothetical protein
MVTERMVSTPLTRRNHGVTSRALAALRSLTTPPWPFVGLTREQAVKELGVSVSADERLWIYAREWLFRALCQ